MVVVPKSKSKVVTEAPHEAGTVGSLKTDQQITKQKKDMSVHSYSSIHPAFSREEKEALLSLPGSWNVLQCSFGKAQKVHENPIQ